MIANLTQSRPSPFYASRSFADSLGGRVGGYNHTAITFSAVDGDDAPTHRQRAYSCSHHQSVATVSKFAGVGVDQNNVSGVGFVNQAQSEHVHLKAARGSVARSVSGRAVHRSRADRKG
jgi:hypothetical protein